MTSASPRTALGVAPSDAPVQQRAFVRRAGVVGAGTLLSRLLGLGREMALAAVFTQKETDAFYVAFTIPNALRQLLGEGAVTNAVIPVLTEVNVREGPQRCAQVFARLRGLSLSVLGLVSVLGVLFAPSICRLFAPGLMTEPDTFARLVRLTEWLFPYIFFIGSAALGIAALHVRQRFVAASFAPALLNVSLIGSALLLPAWLHTRSLDPLYALSFGALAGGVLQVAAQWPSLRAAGFGSRPLWFTGDPAVRRALARLVPMTAGIGVYYVDIVLSRRFLSSLGTGAQSYYTWAMRIADLPQGIFVLAISAAALPSLSEACARQDRPRVVQTFSLGMRLAFLVAVPSTVALICFREPVVRLLFARGHFGEEATRATGAALAWQASAIWAVSATRQLTTVYFAHGDTRTPVLVSAADLGVFVLAALLLRGPMGHVGISAAVAVSSAAQMALLWTGLYRRTGGWDGWTIGRSLLRISAFAFVAAGCTLGAARALGADGNRPLHTLGLLLGFGFLYLLLHTLTQSTELQLVREAVARRAR